MFDPSLKKKLVNETAWSRTYEIEPGYFAYESKLESDNLSISLSELVSAWDSWSDDQKLDFAKAFQAKVRLTVADEEVLEFLMTNGNEQVHSTIALRVARYPQKENALRFLLKELERGPEPKANIIQALYVLGDSAAVPELLVLHNALAREIKEKKERINRWTVIDFLICCEALGYLEGTKAYQEEIREFIGHSDLGVRSRAEMALAGPQPEEFR